MSPWCNLMGFLAAALVFATFFMKSATSLRRVAIASNVAYITYGVLASLYPVLALHLLLLPLNVVRLIELEVENRRYERTDRHLVRQRSVRWLQSSRVRPVGMAVPRRSGRASRLSDRNMLLGRHCMNDDDKTISRAGMIQRLTVAPIAIGALATLRAEAEAAATTDKKVAGYVTHPVGGKQCSGCSLFIPAKSNPMKSPGTCKLVKGPIAPNGWCKFFSPKAP